MGTREFYDDDRCGLDEEEDGDDETNASDSGSSDLSSDFSDSGPSSRKTASWSIRRALLTLLVQTAQLDSTTGELKSGRGGAAGGKGL